MITTDLARRLRDAGMTWTPRSGDRFVVPDRDLDDEVFVVSEMTIETQVLDSGRIFRFNGTTEWALDSVAQDEVLWLPGESQLRSMLGDAFTLLEAVPDGFAVVIERDGVPERHLDIEAERAYARALLAVLEG